MFLSKLQQANAEACGLIGQRRYFEASEILGCILSALFEKRSDFVCTKDPEASFGISTAPLAKDCKVGCPEWDDEFFSFPFAFFFPEEVAFSNTMTERLAAEVAAVVLFNLGLCYQSEAMRRDGRSGTALRNSCNFFGHSWTSIKKFSSSKGDSRLGFLMMAISCNMVAACRDLGELDASSQWLESLRDLLKTCWLKEDNLTVELHNFFLMTSTINTGNIAAGAA